MRRVITLQFLYKKGNLKLKLRGFIEANIDEEGKATLLLDLEQVELELTKEGWKANVTGFEVLHKFGKGLDEVGLDKFGTKITFKQL